MSTLPYHLVIHSRPAGPVAARVVPAGGRDWRALSIDPAALADPLPASFEGAFVALEQFERMFIEPDGSFVWRGESHGRPWQLDGVLYDRAGQLMHVELKGDAPMGPLEQLLTVIGDHRPLVIQLAREGVVVSAEEFLRVLAGD
ncbi:MAG: hypothetical protein JSS27_02420 [Planctomycetes bacterium]|nr:hypothetical protein [Planctomycetota bacterium]